MLKFISGFLTGTVSATVVILMVVLYPATNTTTGQLKSAPQVQEKSPLQGILDQATSQTVQGPQCPRPDEFTRVMNDFKYELDTQRDPRMVTTGNARRIYRTFNRDSIIDYRGYELWHLVEEIFEGCTGLAAPEIVELEEGLLRYTCYDQPTDDSGKFFERIVVAPEDANIFKLCEQSQ